MVGRRSGCFLLGGTNHILEVLFGDAPKCVFFQILSPRAPYHFKTDKSYIQLILPEAPKNIYICQIISPVFFHWNPSLAWCKPASLTPTSWDRGVTLVFPSWRLIEDVRDFLVNPWSSC